MHEVAFGSSTGEATLVDCAASCSLLSCALHHRVRLAGALQAAGRPSDGPRVGALHRRLDVPLEQGEHRVPPSVGQVVVGRALQGLSRREPLELNVKSTCSDGALLTSTIK